LTPVVQQYFDTLKETGETEFIVLVEQQKKILQATRSWSIHEDLGVEARAALGALDALQRLERALEGKYIDFHMSTALDAMNFIFDRGGKVLYKLAAKPSRVQGVADEMTLYFSQLRLEGRDKYRLILVGERNATFEKGTKITVEIAINEASGFRRKADHAGVRIEVGGAVQFRIRFRSAGCADDYRPAGDASGAPCDPDGAAVYAAPVLCAADGRAGAERGAGAAARRGTSVCAAAGPAAARARGAEATALRADSAAGAAARSALRPAAGGTASGTEDRREAGAVGGAETF